ncbi:DUF4440 domain-containing protein [Rouxiella sp. Mn2063]|uniref:DUF4440 domain-containing protein n=1 Tax=Rouxiella sp. Mn2063 TaxID=3395262 RepID=UPI003BC17CE2
MSHADPYINEVLVAHEFIAQVLGSPDATAAQSEALLARFDAAFTMIGVSGTRIDFAGLTQFFNTQRGSKAGLKIQIDQINVVSRWPEGAVVEYREHQTLPGQAATLRRSTVVFTLGESRCPLWRHLHETSVPMSVD